MDATFRLKGLDCPNCAAKIEADTANLPGVASANVNLVRQTMKLRLDEAHEGEFAAIQARIVEIVHGYEPDVEVLADTDKHDILPDKCCDCPHCHECSCDDDDDDDSPWRVRRLITGGIMAVACIVIFYVLRPETAWILPPIVVSYLILGWDVLQRAGRNILKGRVFDENFLMVIATLGAFAIGEYPEAVAVMLFYQIGEFFQDKAVGKSRTAINALLDIRPDMARVMRNGESIEVSPNEVAVGETMMVKPGERIALDGIVKQGASQLDTRALTGESLPREVNTGDEVLSGCINQTAVLQIEVTRPFGESTASRIVDMVENAAGRKAPAERFITRFARYYTPVVVVAAALIALVPILLGVGVWSDWLRRACVFLVISCPCALVISVPLTFFGGIGAASQHGILVKGSSYLDALNRIDTVVFDKTGTLTKGTFNIVRMVPADGVDENALLQAAAIAEQNSNHPIAAAIRREAEQRSLAPEAREMPQNYNESAGYGIDMSYSDDEHYIAGNDKLMAQKEINYTSCDDTGTKVYIAKNHKYLGCIVIADELKADTAEAIKRLKNKYISRTTMLTGDNETIAKDIAQRAGIDDYYSALLPAGKVEKLEAMINEKKHIAFVGDGINDAPVLARADVGIAMGGLGADAAIEAADIVLMTDEPSKLPVAFDIAARTHAIVMQNIIFAIGVKILFLILGACGLIGLWPAVFADVGVMVIAVLNAVRMIKR